MTNADARRDSRRAVATAADPVLRLPKSGPEPLCVLVTRGPAMESRHLVDAVLAEADGRVAAQWGEAAAPIYPRSAVKPLQALPLLETGAADAFGVSDAEIALACASHTGEPVHVAAVGAWLGRLGLGDEALECGAHRPRSEAVLEAFARSGAPLLQAHNNCSGKHAGMLTHARHCGDAPHGYIRVDHPVQRRVAAALAAICATDLADAPCGVDGCGIPTYAMPLDRLALGAARLGTPEGLPPARAGACRRILRAMLAEPYLVAGRDRFCTRMLQAGAGRVVVKAGAEGVFLAALVGQGLGLALKVRDGAGRAAEVACASLLAARAGLDGAALAAIADDLRRPVRNVAGRTVGEVRLADAQ